MLPAASFAVHVIVVIPIGNADGELLDIATCSTSVAVVLPNDTVLSVSEVASTLIYFDRMCFTASFSVHVTAVVSIGNADGELLDIATCSTSVAVVLPNDTVLSVSEVASTLMYFGGVMYGAVV